MKITKKAVSLLLAAVMVLSCFAIAIPFISFAVLDTDIEIDGVTQSRVVGLGNDATDPADDTYEAIYENYAAQYLNGASRPTTIVIPGLDPQQDYVIQGMTYYPARDWMLVTAYHNVADGETTQSSKVFALDAKTGNFVAMFSFKNVDGTTINTDHGGGIAVSEHNIYYSCGDKDRKIAYAPLSALANAPLNAHTTIQLVAEKDFVEIGSISSSSKTAYSAYVCYDEGILWVGNFYDKGTKVIGVVNVAADYNAPSNETYNSMVFGYKLSGSSSAEEWANLTAATGNDRQGNPSYAIGLNNTLKDVQYATVDNGKLYLSRSYGSGAGNSVNFGFGECSYLTVADIDLSVPGTKKIKISTTSTGSLDREVMAYDIKDYTDYPMMPMSEGLCVIEGDIFITFEGASNKYLNESSGLTSIGNCEKPIDVIWQLDPYELMEVEVAEPEKSIYYEKVNTLSEIEDGEYIIVHESTQKDPVTQKPYLYALDAYGNFKDYKLSKSTLDSVNGYDGMIGHPISYYSIVEDDDGETRLYLDNPEIDDVKNIRWTLRKAETDGYYTITSTDPYFANCNNLYVDQNHITMMPSGFGDINKMNLLEADLGENGRVEGGFWIANSGAYFLWCNEGTSDRYNNAYNAYYYQNSGTYPIFSGLTEQPGTFHCDALGWDETAGSVGNVIGGEIDTGADTFYRDGLFNIYRRVVDEVASTYESRVYTNLKASLQADGTYTVELDTYAISPNHYRYVGERPTDYIIVTDTSTKMDETSGTRIVSWYGGGNDTLKVSSLTDEENTKADNGEGVLGYAFSKPNEEIYYQHTDGRYYKIYLAVNTVEYSTFIGMVTKIRQIYWAYYIADDGLYYVLQTNGTCGGTTGGVFPGITATEFINHVDNAEYYSAESSKINNSDRITTIVYDGPHHRFDNINSIEDHRNEGANTLIRTLKESACNLVDQIAAQNSNNRIALVQIGADASTGYYNTTSGTLINSGYTDAFWSASATNAAALKTKINAFTTSTQTSNTGIEMTVANSIIANSGINYKADGDRNLAIIFISDGIPGADDTRYTTEAGHATVDAALQAKNNGAFIYTVLIGNNTSGPFDKKTYMDAVSSKYPAAQNMDNLGGESTDGVNYALNLATCSINNFVFFGNEACEEVAHNNAVGLDNLNAESYLREQLSEAFIFPEGWSKDENLKTYYAKGDYDAIGRFSFGEPYDTPEGEIISDVNTSTRTVTVTNYDYSKNYIARGNDDGKALKVVISGLLPNEEEGKIENTSINDTDTTGLYKTKAIMDDPEGKAFKYLPTEYFNIPTYNFTLDFGFDMLDDDVNGTLCAVSDSLSVQDPDAYVKETENGMFKIETGDKNLIYSLDPETPNSKGYVLIKRDEGEFNTGEYDWFCIQLLPASNVYYEQNRFDIDSEKTVSAGENGEGKWTSVGTQNFTYQKPVNPETDIHGWDGNYETDGNDHSNGVASKVTINNTTKKSDTQTFEFYGTGFDLVSACGARTGIITVKVTDKDGNLVKAYLVDTYYRDTAILDPSNTLEPENELLYQVPVVSFVNTDENEEVKEGNFKVEVTAVYLSSSNALKTYAISDTEVNSAGEIEATSVIAEDDSAIYDELAALGMNDIANSELELVWFDDNSILNGGTGAYGTEDDIEMAAESNHRDLSIYLDGFRIYHPLGTGDSANANYILSEQNAEYINVINNISYENDLKNIAYIGRALTDSEELTFKNYQKEGPQNELYLTPGSDEALAFTVQLKDTPENAKVHLGLRAVTGNAKVTIGTVDGGREFEIKSATEMYYDITELLVVDQPTGTATITIKNTGTTGMLAVNNIKMTRGGAVAAISEDDIDMFSLAMNAPAEEAYVVNGKVTTEKAEEPAPEPEVPAEKTFIEKAVEFIKNVFAKVFGFISNAFVFLSKGGLF